MQHAHYEQRLTDAGCEIVRLNTSEELPDSVFVEDTAVVFDELALISRPGATSRRAETVAVAEALRLRRVLRFIEPPGSLDGGDVLVVGRRRSSRLPSPEIGRDICRRRYRPDQPRVRIDAVL